MTTRDNDRKKLNTFKGKKRKEGREGRREGGERKKPLFITPYSQVFNSPNIHLTNVY